VVRSRAAEAAASAGAACGQVVASRLSWPPASRVSVVRTFRARPPPRRRR